MHVEQKDIIKIEKSVLKTKKRSDQRKAATQKFSLEKKLKIPNASKKFGQTSDSVKILLIFIRSLFRQIQHISFIYSVYSIPWLWFVCFDLPWIFLSCFRGFLNIFSWLPGFGMGDGTPLGFIGEGVPKPAFGVTGDGCDGGPCFGKYWKNKLK